MKSNNIIIGTLVAIVAVMGVAFAAFSTTLNINGTATISSTWNVTFTAGTCSPTIFKDAAAKSSGTVSLSGTTATITANMSSPGDQIICTITANNEGTLAAIRTSWSITSAVTNADAYTVEAVQGTPTALAAGTGTETLSVRITYKDVTTKPIAAATFKAVATYAQDL